MTCREFADFLLDYVSGDLPGSTLAVFEDHLSRCVNCRRYLAGYRESVALGRRAFEDDGLIPKDVPEELLQSILAATRSPS